MAVTPAVEIASERWGEERESSDVCIALCTGASVHTPRPPLHPARRTRIGVVPRQWAGRGSRRRCVANLVHALQAPAPAQATGVEPDLPAPSPHAQGSPETVGSPPPQDTGQRGGRLQGRRGPWVTSSHSAAASHLGALQAKKSVQAVGPPQAATTCGIAASKGLAESHGAASDHGVAASQWGRHKLPRRVGSPQAMG